MADVRTLSQPQRGDRNELAIADGRALRLIGQLAQPFVPVPLELPLGLAECGPEGASLTSSAHAHDEVCDSGSPVDCHELRDGRLRLLPGRAEFLGGRQAVFGIEDSVDLSQRLPFLRWPHWALTWLICGQQLSDEPPAQPFTQPVRGLPPARLVGARTR